MKPRFSRTDWLDHALAQLSADGPEALKLEAVCQSAGLTRGSFYHHFKTHEAFLTATAERWAQRQSTDLVADVDPSAISPEMLAELNSRAMSIDYRMELGIRELGRRVPEVNAIVATTDAHRLTFTAQVYQARFGLDPETAREAAELEYAAFVGTFLINPDIPLERQQQLAARYDRMISVFYKGPAT